MRQPTHGNPQLHACARGSQRGGSTSRIIASFGARSRKACTSCLSLAIMADERVQLDDAGQVELKLETPWRDGTMHLVRSPLKLMQRLAALAPPGPGLHLLRWVSARWTRATSGSSSSVSGRSR